MAMILETFRPYAMQGRMYVTNMKTGEVIPLDTAHRWANELTTSLVLARGTENAGATDALEREQRRRLMDDYWWQFPCHCSEEWKSWWFSLDSEDLCGPQHHSSCPSYYPMWT